MLPPLTSQAPQLRKESAAEQDPQPQQESSWSLLDTICSIFWAFISFLFPCCCGGAEADDGEVPTLQNRVADPERQPPEQEEPVNQPPRVSRAAKAPKSAFEQAYLDNGNKTVEVTIEVHKILREKSSEKIVKPEPQIPALPGQKPIERVQSKPALNIHVPEEDDRSSAATSPMGFAYVNGEYINPFALFLPDDTEEDDTEEVTIAVSPPAPAPVDAPDTQTKPTTKEKMESAYIKGKERVSEAANKGWAFVESLRTKITSVKSGGS